jgi:hypothetical protein
LTKATFRITVHHKTSADALVHAQALNCAGQSRICETTVMPRQSSIDEDPPFSLPACYCTPGPTVRHSCRGAFALAVFDDELPMCVTIYLCDLSKCAEGPRFDVHSSFSCTCEPSKMFDCIMLQVPDVACSRLTRLGLDPKGVNSAACHRKPTACHSFQIPYRDICR